MIEITESAKEKLIQILSEENATLIRFGLQGGGCNGFQYLLIVEQNQQDDDFEYSLNESYKFLVDSVSHMYLENALVDYKKDIMGENFVFDSPSMTSKCGCGQSVSF